MITIKILLNLLASVALVVSPTTFFVVSCKAPENNDKERAIKKLIFEYKEEVKLLIGDYINSKNEETNLFENKYLNSDQGSNPTNEFLNLENISKVFKSNNNQNLNSFSQLPDNQKEKLEKDIANFIKVDELTSYIENNLTKDKYKLILDSESGFQNYSISKENFSINGTFESDSNVHSAAINLNILVNFSYINYNGDKESYSFEKSLNFTISDDFFVKESISNLENNLKNYLFTNDSKEFNYGFLDQSKFINYENNKSYSDQSNKGKFWMFLKESKKLFEIGQENNLSENLKTIFSGEQFLNDFRSFMISKYFSKFNSNLVEIKIDFKKIEQINDLFSEQETEVYELDPISLKNPGNNAYNLIFSKIHDYNSIEKDEPEKIDALKTILATGLYNRKDNYDKKFLSYIKENIKNDKNTELEKQFDIALKEINKSKYQATDLFAQKLLKSIGSATISFDLEIKLLEYNKILTFKDFNTIIAFVNDYEADTSSFFSENDYNNKKELTIDSNLVNNIYDNVLLGIEGFQKTFGIETRYPNSPNSNLNDYPWFSLSGKNEYFLNNPKYSYFWTIIDKYLMRSDTTTANLFDIVMNLNRGNDLSNYNTTDFGGSMPEITSDDFKIILNKLLSVSYQNKFYWSFIDESISIQKPSSVVDFSWSRNNDISHGDNFINSAYMYFKIDFINLKINVANMILRKSTIIKKVT